MILLACLLGLAYAQAINFYVAPIRLTTKHVINK